MVHSTRRSIALAASLLIVAGLPACSKEGPDKALSAFITAWGNHDLNDQAFMTPDGRSVAGTDAQRTLTGAEGDLEARHPKLTLKGKPVSKNDDASAVVTVAWPVADNVTWTYDTTVNLHRSKDKWKVVFNLKTLNPDLETGDKLTIKSVSAQRGDMLDGGGQPMVTTRPVVTIGLVPRSITDVPATQKALTDALASVGTTINLSDLPKRLGSVKSDQFVEIITLRQDVFDKIAGKINSVVGTVTRKSTQSLAPSAQFARALLGNTGQVTKEIMDKSPGKYKIGDVVGLAGLQQRYDDQLRGTPGISVVVPKPEGVPDKVLFKTDPKPGTVIKTTLDVKLQQAAEAALNTDSRRSALVAIKISTNQIVAVANGPGIAANNFALVGQVPPGSTFKTITALGVLENGSVNVNTPVNCPKTLTVDGRTFKNSHGEELGSVPLHVDFAKSCNTAFASLAPKLGPDGLAKTAATVGIGVPWDLGAGVFTGKVSANGPAAEQAAAAFGQGTTLVSPVVLAGAAAAIARGQWKQPTLVADPAPTKVAADGPALQPASLDALRQMMREVVTSGTASQLKNLPGDLRGKTGTAEYDGNPAHTHSWFMGFRGDIAFCVFVENGGASTAAAVPIAGKFFQSIG